MTNLRTAPAARTDLRDIGTYSKTTFGSRVGSDYLDGLIGAFDRLAARPMAGVAERDLGEGMRSFLYRSHRIYYRVEGDDLLIVRVLHHARDITTIFDRSQ
ncbi:type II toxin-antitoxin system RelE/ParE family toxin [Sphingomonas sp. RS2018]